MMTGARRHPWPVGMLGMLALVLAAESYVARHDLDFATLWSANWRHGAAAARREGPKSAVLAFGDSLVKDGVAAPVIEARLGRRAYNLAVFNGQAPASYFLLRRALDAGARPAAVLIDGELLEAD